MSLCVAIGVGTVLDVALDCRPFAYNWDKTIPGGTCVDFLAGWLVPCIVNLVTDIIVAILPLPIIWSLQMRPLRKITVSLIFSMGIG